jgi:DNA-binding response OmpR family regulator
MKRVLVVESNTDLLRDRCADLEENDHGVTSARSVSEARRLLATRPFDVIIANAELNDGSGWALIQEARARAIDYMIVQNAEFVG